MRKTFHKETCRTWSGFSLLEHQGRRLGGECGKHCEDACLEGPRIPFLLQKKLLHVQQLSLECWLRFLNCGCDHWNLYLERSGFKCSIFSKSFKIPVLYHRGLGLFYQGIYWNWSTEPYWEPAGVGNLFPTLNLSPFLSSACCSLCDIAVLPL